MRQSAVKGICFGLTSGIITTLGMIVGLSSFTGSRLVVMGGVLSIAIADAFSDSLGIHMSEESERKSTKNVWVSTISTFLSKLIFASTFIIPIMFFELGKAIIISVIWGLLALALLNYFIAKERKENPLRVISEHLLLATLVVAIIHYIGILINVFFG
ncbi:hypothetical protein D6745_03685 [Candidatus Woesearchaeota archaeon]|nr:MAG: hypothetical protein D6745_03685 [Candidatus Woesearchaeota archaeon]